MECNHGLSKACPILPDGAVQLDQKMRPYLCLAKLTLSLWFIRLSLLMKDASLGVYHFLSSCFTAQPFNVALEVANSAKKWPLFLIEIFWITNVAWGLLGCKMVPRSFKL